MKLGLSSYTYGWAVGARGHEPATPMDEHGLVDQVLAHGLSLLQIGDNLPLDTFNQPRLHALRDRAVREGIQLEVGARRLTLEKIKRHAEIARILGSKLIRFIVDDIDFHPAPNDIVKTLREAASSLDGLSLGIENHDRFRAAELRNIIESVGADNVGICLDTANSLGAGEDVHTVISELGTLTFNLHIKDFSVRRLPHMMGFTVAGTAAGSGILNIPALLKELVPYRRCDTAVLELWTPPEPDLAMTIEKESVWAANSVKFLKPLFASSSR